MAKAKKAKNATFTWECTNTKGATIKGETTAVSADVVKAQLRKQGLTPKKGKIKKKGSSLFPASTKPITTSDIAVFSRQLATMIKAGVPMVQAFDIVGQGHSNPSMGKLIMELKADVEAGGTLATALSNHPAQFDELFVSLVDAGEQSGALETLLEKVATYKEKSEALRIKIKKALTYPISVLVVAIIVSSILLIFVIPIFADMFKSFGAELPAFTQFVVGLSDGLIANVWYFIAVIIGIVFGLKQLKIRSKAYNEGMDKLALKLPGVGTLTTNAAIARFARTLATMFAAGVPLVEAMVSVAGAAGNVVYKKAILQVRDDIAGGTTLQASLSQNKDLFPNMLIQMVGIGEESGALDDMLDKVAEYYESAVDDSVDNLTALMEPLIMSFLAVVVGGLVIAMYMPIFKMGSVM
ncbi:Type IV fimbrial assembly protein PilC [hydrothermal vent metagenome]|uniref:Type IV fimbrial assembly protein PilC n=1 Tax=hydrothermal vent metagenome TaxID=652676 RepID=A0A3B0WHZ2_9ZZZZ